MAGDGSGATDTGERVYLDLLAEHLQHLIWITDPAGTILWFNRRWFDYTGVSPVELMGGARPLVHPDDLTRVAEGLGGAFARGDDWSDELRLLGKDGSYRWFAGRALPVRDETGAIVRWFGAASDVNDLRNAAAELRQLNETLEARVVSRTAELESAHEQLRHSQKLESIGQLTGGVAHDFNNLLTVILGNIDVISRQLQTASPDMGRLQRNAENALRGARRAATLTRQLLAYSRRQPLAPKPVDVNRLVLGMSDLLRRTLGEKVQIETVLGGGVWATLVDPNQLEIALLNLAVNARDAMPAAGKLTIETANAHLDDAYAARQAEIAPGQYVQIAVSDTGSGIAPEHLDRVFEPFFTTKDIGQGTGLGLSQVYGFVRQSGGHIRIYSELGSGTVVRIYLPRLLSGVPDEANPQHSATPPRPVSPRQTILLVEDDFDVRTYSTEMLAELGFQVIAAASGQAALEQLEQNPGIRIMFTDVGLPGGMNGRQLALEAVRRRPDLRVLYTTGYAKNAIVHEGRLDPGLMLVTKPFTIEELSAALEAIIDGSERAPTVLLVEDEELLRLVVVEGLEEAGLRISPARSASEALALFNRLRPAVSAAVIDIHLPDRSGLALAAELRALDPALPIVIAAGDLSEAEEPLRRDALMRGLQKPYDVRQLAGMLRDLSRIGRSASRSASVNNRDARQLLHGRFVCAEPP